MGNRRWLRIVLSVLWVLALGCTGIPVALVAVPVVLAALLAGCSASSHQRPTAAPSMSAPPTPSPTEPQASVQQYAGLVNESVKKIRETYQRYRDGGCEVGADSATCGFSPRSGHPPRNPPYRDGSAPPLGLAGRVRRYLQVVADGVASVEGVDLGVDHVRSGGAVVADHQGHGSG